MKALLSLTPSGQESAGARRSGRDARGRSLFCQRSTTSPAGKKGKKVPFMVSARGPETMNGTFFHHYLGLFATAVWLGVALARHGQVWRFIKSA
jgi:hypothetical protein